MNRQDRRRQAREARRTGGAAAGALSPARDALQEARVQQALHLMQEDKTGEAAAVLKDAAAQAPDDAGILNLAGIAAFRTGDAGAAQRYLQRAVQLSPALADAHVNLGNVHRAADRPADAEACYRRALALEADNLDALFNLGLLQETAGDFASALNSYKACLKQKPRFAEASFNLANVMKALSRLAEAEAAYRDAIEARARFPEAWSNLGTVLHEQGDRAGAIEAYERALALDNGFAEAHYNRGIALQEEGTLDAAAAAYRAAIAAAAASDDNHIGARLNLAATLRELGDLDAAEAAYRDTAAAAPDYAKAAVELASQLMERGDLEGAEAVTADFLARHPGDLSALAFRTILLPQMGRGQEAHDLSDFGRLILPVECHAPPDFDDIAAFNRALAAHVLEHPSLVEAPASHATRNGRHSGELLVEPKGPMADFEMLVQQAVEAWMQTVAADPAHPFLARRPSRLGLTAWAVVMQRQGHQVPHIHPSAWLSGVYYVKLPSAVQTAAADHAGWIEFGRPPDEFALNYTPDVERVQPAEGLMLLFPSYLYHRTIPYESDETRISIAFDVLTDL